LCWLLLFGSSPSFFFFGSAFVFLPSVCVWCYQLFFLLILFCLLNGSKEREIQLHDDCHICTILFLLHNSTHFFFLSLLLLRGGGKRFFSLVGWRASLVNASRRRPSSKGVICGYQLARTIYFIPVQSQTVRNHLIFFLTFLTMMTQ
jgi:hypothetical protein